MDVAAFTADLVARGIDIVVPCDVRWYNAHVAEHALPLRPLPNFDRPDAPVSYTHLTLPTIYSV